jgi:hypothetical protein
MNCVGFAGRGVDETTAVRDAERGETIEADEME